MLSCPKPQYFFTSSLLVKSDNYIHSSVRVCCQVSPLTLVALVSGSAHASNEYIHIASFPADVCDLY